MPHTPLVVETIVSELARRPRAPRYWIAHSGGLDSTVLAHICHAIRSADDGYEFAAVHVHHGLHPDAKVWARHVEQQCQSLQLPLEIRHVDARPAPGQSLEASARDARYAAFAALLQPNEVLLTAQHQDDQAETLLIQLLRGAGPAGLASMPAWAPFGDGYLSRPFLEIPRRSLQDYALKNRLRWIDDPSNDDTRFGRNYLRREILPRLRHRWPSVAATLSRSARHCAEADALLRELAAELLSELRDPQRNTLQIERLRSLTAARQRLVLRHWFRTSGLRPPSTKLIVRILEELVNARDDRHPMIDCEAGTVRRYRGELHLLAPLPTFEHRPSITWPTGDGPLILPGAGRIIARRTAGPGIDPRHWNTARVDVRFRQGGETITLGGRSGTRSMKKLLQQTDLPPWLRERLPLIYIDGRLAAIADYHVAAEFAGDPRRENVRIDWERPTFAVQGPPSHTMNV